VPRTLATHETHLTDYRLNYVVKKFSSRLTLFLAALVLAASSFAQDAIFINVADTHSAYDAYPKIISAVWGIVATNPQADAYVVFNGDVFELGNTVASRNAGDLDWQFLERLNAIAPVIFNIGNHEFDFISYRRFLSEARARKIEVIGGIVDAEAGIPLQSAYVTVPAGPGSITVVGIATNQMSTYPAAMREAVRVADPARQIRNVPANLPNLYVLTHAGVAADRQIMQLLNPSNTLVVVGGHDHLSLSTEYNGHLYQHNGLRGEYLRVVEATAVAEGWQVETRVVPLDAVAADVAFTAQVAAAREALLEPADLESVGTVPAALSVRQAADWATAALRDAVGADVALLNHTSFGSGLEAGELSRYRFNEFMRFDNDVMVAEIDSDTMATILSRANFGSDTPLETLSGDFVYSSPLTVEPGRTYRLVTSSWIALDFNQKNFLGVEGIQFEKLDGVTTKGLLAESLQ